MGLTLNRIPPRFNRNLFGKNLKNHLSKGGPAAKTGSNQLFDHRHGDPVTLGLLVTVTFKVASIVIWLLKIGWGIS